MKKLRIPVVYRNSKEMEAFMALILIGTHGLNCTAHVGELQQEQRN